MYARGLSMRDIEVAFTDVHGRSAPSRSAASPVAERLWDDYQAFSSRGLSELNIVYLFVDGVAERLHLGQPRGAGAGRLGHRCERHQAFAWTVKSLVCCNFVNGMRV